MGQKPINPAIGLFIFLTLGLAELPFFAFGAGFYDLSPKAETIEGINYPRNKGWLYRGTSDDQMDLSKAVSALLGDEDSHIESFFVSTIKYQLMGLSYSKAVGLSPEITNKIQGLIKDSGGYLNLKKATAEALRIADETFEYLKTNHLLIPRYIEYRSSQYMDWPNDVVFSTVISPIAGTYGNRVLVISEKTPRSLDLNFWNHSNSDRWYTYTRDIGEFIAYGYIPGTDLVGFQDRRGSDKGSHSIQYAVYRFPEKNPDILLVLNGFRKSRRLSSCIDFDVKTKGYFHCNYEPGTLATAIPSLSSERVRVAGVLKLCPANQKNSNETQACLDSAKAYLKRYEEDDRLPISDALNAEIQKKIKNLTISGKSVYYINDSN